eukprot:3049209-Pyramimonas_sp.AAC.1
MSVVPLCGRARWGREWSSLWGAVPPCGRAHWAHGFRNGRGAAMRARTQGPWVELPVGQDC